MKKHQAGLAFIFITILIDVLGFGLIVPILPDLVKSLAKGSTSSGAHYLGLLLSVFGLMQFLFSPVLGSLSDRFGRRPILLLSLFFTSIDYVLSALAPSLSWLFVGRILAGITGASFTAATAYIADISPPEKRAQNFGLIGAAFGVGFIVGPAMGGILGKISLRTPFWAAAALSLLNCLYGLFILPESLSIENRRAFSLKNANPVGALYILSRYRWVLAMAGSIGLLGLAQQALQSTWILYTSYRFRWSPVANGLSMALLGVASILVQVFLIGRLVPKLGEKRAIIIGMFFNFVGFLGFALASRGWMMIAMMLIWSISFISGPTTQSLISKEYGPDEQGAVQGSLTSLQSLTGIVGPLLATSVFGYFTSQSAPFALPGSPFFLGALLIAVSSVLAVRALQSKPLTLDAD